MICDKCGVSPQTSRCVLFRITERGVDPTIWRCGRCCSILGPTTIDKDVKEICSTLVTDKETLH